MDSAVELSLTGRSVLDYFPISQHAATPGEQLRETRILLGQHDGRAFCRKRAQTFGEYGCDGG